MFAETKETRQDARPRGSLAWLSSNNKALEEPGTEASAHRPCEIQQATAVCLWCAQRKGSGRGTPLMSSLPALTLLFLLLEASAPSISPPASWAPKLFGFPPVLERDTISESQSEGPSLSHLPQREPWGSDVSSPGRRQGTPGPEGPGWRRCHSLSAGCAASWRGSSGSSRGPSWSALSSSADTSSPGPCKTSLYWDSLILWNRDGGYTVRHFHPPSPSKGIASAETGHTVSVHQLPFPMASTLSPALSKVLRRWGDLRRKSLSHSGRDTDMQTSTSRVRTGQGTASYDKGGPGPESGLLVWPHTLTNQKVSQIWKIRRSDLTRPTDPHQAINQLEHSRCQSTCAPPACIPTLGTPSTADSQVPQTKRVEVLSPQW